MVLAVFRERLTLEKMASNDGILCSRSYNFYGQHVDGDDKDTVQLEIHKAVAKSEM